MKICGIFCIFQASFCVHAVFQTLLQLSNMFWQNWAWTLSHFGYFGGTFSGNAIKIAIFLTLIHFIVLSDNVGTKMSLEFFLFTVRVVQKKFSILQCYQLIELDTYTVKNWKLSARVILRALSCSTCLSIFILPFWFTDMILSIFKDLWGLKSWFLIFIG